VIENLLIQWVNATVVSWTKDSVEETTGKEESKPFMFRGPLKWGKI
jgi:hypothetical protein